MDGIKNDVKLRLATKEDMNFFFELRNDVEVRNNSFSQEEITYEQHVAWYMEKLRNSNCKLYILECISGNIGQVRVDTEKKNSGEKENYISYSIMQDYRKKGYAKRMLKLLEGIVGKDSFLVGEVKQKNIASQYVFRSLGYSEKPTKYGYQYIKQIK